MSEKVPVTDERIKELRAMSLPHATVDVFEGDVEGKFSCGETPVEEYVSHFLPKQSDCPNCENSVIDWTLQHGVAMCWRCGWPCRVYHYFSDQGTEDSEQREQLPLWYHPDSIVLHEEEESEEDE